MDWGKGYTASYYGCYVDPGTWRDLERFEIISGSISKGSDDLRESADITTTNYDEIKERWIRIYLDAEQNGDISHNALFTGLATSPSKDMDGNLTEHKLTVYSVLKPAEDILLDRGWYAPQGVSGAEIIKELLEVIPAPVTISGRAPSLTNDIVAEDGETCLTMAEKILQAINWRILIEGDGTVTLTNKAASFSVMFDDNSTDIIEPEISIAKDWFNCPNVFRAVSEDNTAVAEDLTGGYLSIEGRGRRVMAEELNAEVADDESLQEYAERRLAEEQQIQKTASYSRCYIPNIHVTDIVNFHYEQLTGDFIVTEQKITLDHKTTVDEEVVQYG